MKTNAQILHGTNKKYTELKTNIYTGHDGCGTNKFRAHHLNFKWHRFDLYNVTFGWIEEYDGVNYLHERVSHMDIVRFFDVFNIL